MNARSPLTAAVLALILIVIGACGGSERAATILLTATPVETSTAPAEPTANPKTSSPAATAVEGDELVERLPEALLALEDMPAGWTVRVIVDDEEDDGSTICGVASGQFSRDAFARFTADFQKAEFGPFLDQVVDYFPEGEAERVMAEFSDAFRSCTEWTVIEEDGTETTWRLGPLSFPKIGDETFAFRMSTVTFLGAVELDFITWRRQDIVVVIAHTSIGFEGIDGEQTEAFVRRADEKLRAFLD